MGSKAYKAAWYEANRERLAQRARERYLEQRPDRLAKAKRRYEQNPAALKEASKAYYASLSPDKKRQVVERAAVRDKTNPVQARARTSLRRKRHQQATPPWLTREHRRQIKDAYVRASRVTEETGVFHSVDHVVPLASRLVCGLHTPWNLRVIPHGDNIKKGNRAWPDMP